MNDVIFCVGVLMLALGALGWCLTFIANANDPRVQVAPNLALFTATAFAGAGLMWSVGGFT